MRYPCALTFGIVAVFALSVRAEPVESLLEQRQQFVVTQQWDLSCGAAALATILNYQHGDAVAEREIAIGMMSRDEYLANPELVNLRQGFSLLDMKRFVDARGYNGVGLGQLDLADLIEHAPIIVPIDFYGYQHFVVFRGALGNRVLLADPAFGNHTMSRSSFEQRWLSIADLGRVGFYVERTDSLIPPNRLQPRNDEFLTLR
jgi:predicted double-glycine peptidase